MTPTTGDVVRLVVARQSDRRDAEQALNAAAAAAGLEPLESRNPRAMSVEALTDSSVRELALEAAEMHRRTGADGVHLRHVLATGVHPAVPQEALAELGVSLDEVREEWRPSIARKWPDESQEGWDEILLGERSDDGLGTAPPSARVHADTWTTEDRLNYALYAKAIAEFICHEDAKPPMVISVQAPWGQGKTSLMRMVQRHLDPDHPDLRDPKSQNGKSGIVEPPSALTFGDLRQSLDGTVEVSETKPAQIRTVWFNAWKYQSSEQIWAGLAHAILSQLPARLEPKDRELFWLRLQLRRIDPSAVRADIYRAALERFLPRLAGLVVLALGILVVAGLALVAGGLGALGVGVAGTGVLGIAGAARRAWAAATKDVLRRPLEGAYQRYVQQPDYTGKLGYLHLVEEDMVRALELLTPDDQPAVIFIDDLDRCSPAKVGEVIEAVNLFLAGDYPNCAFVIGIDAEVVAASMEVVHEQIIQKLDDRRGELGWRFMDKFVQLPFVIPRLHPDQREAFLRGLFSIPGEEEEVELVAEAEKLTSEARSGSQDVDELARRAGELAPRLAKFAPEKARALGEEVVSAGARSFSDSKPEVIQALADQLRYLSDNPRTIKRAVNLDRFHRFAAFARKASTLPLAAATPEQIGRWIVVIIRWPHFVRWLQAQREEAGSPAKDPASRVLDLAGESDTPEAFTEALGDRGIDASWTHDAELWEFLREEAHPDLKLDLAGPRGLW
jgi:KAP family P-loop domain